MHTREEKLAAMREALSRRAEQKGFRKDSPQWQKYVEGSMKIISKRGK